MNRPMSYQHTDSDSVAASLLNGMNFVFGDDILPNEILKTIYSCVLNIYDDASQDVSDALLFYFSKWLNDFARTRHLSVNAKFVRNNDVNILKFRQTLILGGCVILKIKKTDDHYVLLTNMDADYLYVFDPDYLSVENDSKIEGIDVFLSNDINFNRKIKIDLLLRDELKNYSMGPAQNRTALLIWRLDDLLTREYE